MGNLPTISEQPESKVDYFRPQPEQYAPPRAIEKPQPPAPLKEEDVQITEEEFNAMYEKLLHEK